MQKELRQQHKLFIEILRRFKQEGVLKSIILVGSWCIPLYKKYFKELKTLSPIRTRDMDFLVPLNSKFKHKLDVLELLKDLGFKNKFYGTQGYIKLIHSLLILEFLVPEKGRATDKPYELSALGINAQRLRFMEMLTENTIKVKVEEIDVIVPHPVNYAFHKLLICKRREGSGKKEKSEKDKAVAIQILRSLLKAKEIAPIKGLFRPLHKNRKKEILKTLEEEKEYPILEVLREVD